MTDARSTTVAPVISAWWRNSIGTHVAGSPKTGSRVGMPGSAAGVVAEHEHVAGRRFAAPDVDAVHADRVRARRELEVVAGAHERDDDAELERELAAERAHAVEEVAALGRVDEVDEVVRDLELERLDAHLADEVLGRVGRELGRRDLDLLWPRPRCAAISSSLGSRVARSSSAPPTMKNGSLGRPGTIATAQIAPPPSCSVRLCRVNWWSRSVPRSISVAARVTMRPDDERDEQRGDLRDEAVTDGEEAVRLDRVAERQVLLQDADREAADRG